MLKYIPLILAAGCASVPDAPVVDIPMPVLRAAVVSGLTKVDPAAYGGWDGDCPGCDLDAQRMAALLKSRGFAVKPLLNSESTRFKFLSACASASVSLAPAANAGLQPILAIYNSSHGGQIPDINGDEADRLDETICLWDGQLTDDLMWEALCKVPAGVTVVFITDSCNSGTAFRAPKNWARVVHARATRDPGTLKCGFVYMGGCPDGESSYGDTDGGVFTNRLLAEFKPGVSWRAWFKAAFDGMPRNQKPVMSWLGQVDPDREAL